MSVSVPCRQLRATFFLTAVIALVPVTGRGEGDPRVLLERMGRAVEQLNYTGTLVHMNGAETSLLHIVHRVEGGRVSERIRSDDAGREIVRNDDEVTCIFPDQQVVVVERRSELDRSHSPLLGRLPAGDGIRSAHYHIAFAGTGRIAGREARIIAIRPADSFRYGYRIWVDQPTAMPLKTQLLDEAGGLLEQILFSEISLPASIAEEAVRPSMPVKGYAVRHSEPMEGSLETGVDWAATEVPAGFSLALRQSRMMADAERGLRHLVYSDGLATVSLFIEPAVAAAEQVEGLSQIGAANAYTTVHDGYMVTAVGDVPSRTVELFALSARPLTRGAPTGGVAGQDPLR
jgi:sigma-E factor negative regulatory protein RseB